jgi:hypothetical protein
MGTWISASEAARLVGVCQRTMFTWLKYGKHDENMKRVKLTEAQATKQRTIGHLSWIIDADALDTLPGVHVDRARLAELEATRSPGTIESRLESLERKFEVLDKQRPGPPGEQPSPTTLTPDTPPVHPIEAAPIPLQAWVLAHPRQPAPGKLAHYEPLSAFAEAHGVPRRTAKGHAERHAIPAELKPSPNRPRENPYWVNAEQKLLAMAFWRDRWIGTSGETVRECANSVCICHELLGE